MSSTRITLTPHDKRWSPVSASANAENSYQKFLREKPNAYEYVCVGSLPGESGDDEEEEEEDEDEDEAEAGDKKRPECEGKPAADYPEHRWTFTRAGLQKRITYKIMLDLRDPDSFEMYTFNDHAGFGAIEVVQNMMIDFEEASGKWQQQWAVIEALAWLLSGGFLSPMEMVEDGDLFRDTSILLEHMFLAMLAELDKQGQLEAHSDVRNIGLVMGLLAKQAEALRYDGSMEAEESGTKPYYGRNFIPYLLAYARKGNIDIHGPSGLDKIISKAEESSEEQNVELPPAQKDPWKWDEAFKAYCKRNATSGYGGAKPTIGGDKLDITTYSSAERKKKSFDKKDPLTPDVINAIEQGLVLQLG